MRVWFQTLCIDTSLWVVANLSPELLITLAVMDEVLCLEPNHDHIHMVCDSWFSENLHGLWPKTKKTVWKYYLCRQTFALPPKKINKISWFPTADDFWSFSLDPTYSRNWRKIKLWNPLEVVENKQLKLQQRSVGFLRCRGDTLQGTNISPKVGYVSSLEGVPFSK